MNPGEAQAAATPSTGHLTVFLGYVGVSELSGWPYASSRHEVSLEAFFVGLEWLPPAIERPTVTVTRVSIGLNVKREGRFYPEWAGSTSPSRRYVQSGPFSSIST